MTEVPILCDVHALLDSKAVEAWAWEQWAAYHAIDPVPFIASPGLRAEDTIRRLTPHLDPQEEVRRWLGMATRCPLPAKAYEGAARLLSLPRIALVTSGSRALVTSQLRDAGLVPLDLIISAEDVKRGKPRPEPFLMAARMLDAPPSECLVLDDTVPGVIAGVKAGMTVIAVATTVIPGELIAAGARLVVDDIATFLELRAGGSLPV
jgi:mannitol-1-/sugar-/sorbitol-6-phosphatase